MIGVGREHPEAILTGLGLAPPDPVATAETHPYLLEFYECLTAVERVEFLMAFQAEVDGNTSTKRDIIDALPESEAACIRESLTEQEYAALLETTVHEASRTTEPVSGCITPDGYVEVFVAIASSQAGGLSKGTRSCLADFAREHPHYAALINPDSYDPPATTPSELAEIADDGPRTWNCLSDKELTRMQDISLGALAQQKPPCYHPNRPISPQRPTRNPRVMSPTSPGALRRKHAWLSHLRCSQVP